jgi:hypothetical protein
VDMMYAAINAADLDLPPKQCTRIPPAFMPASINIDAAGIHSKIFASSLYNKNALPVNKQSMIYSKIPAYLSRKSIVRYENLLGYIGGNRDEFRICMWLHKEGFISTTDKSVLANESDLLT